MTRIVLLVALALGGCNQQTGVEPYCGQADPIWIPAEDIRHPHLAVEHLVEITHANQVLINSEPSSADAVAKFLTANISTPATMIYFDFDAHADCKLVQEVRSTIKKSGICTDKNCITGNDDETPPPEPN